VDVYRLDDTGAQAVAYPIADVPGASGSRFVAPMPFGGASRIVALRVAATPVPGGNAEVVVAVLSESGTARRLWTGALATCAL
jgi:hypothetical protein